MAKKNPTSNQTFTVQQSTLNKSLNICSKALGDSKIIPIYEMFLLSINGPRLDISACDGKIIISTACDITSSVTSRICILGRKLLDYVSKSNNELLIFEIEKQVIPASMEIIKHPTTGNDQEINTPEQVSYSITIKTSSGKCTIPCEPGDYFPHIKNIDPKPFTIPADDLLVMLNRTMFAISSDGLRPAMSGLYVQITGGKMTCTATDAHKLATFSVPIDTLESAEMVIPKETLVKIQALNPTGKLDVCISKSAIDINWGEIKTCSLLVDERYPDYQSVLPIANHIDFVTSKSGLISSLKRILPFTDITSCIQLHVSADHLLLVAENTDFSEDANETIPGAIANGEPILIGANGGVLLNVLAALSGDNVWFSFSSPNRAMIITDERREDATSKENLFLLMPSNIAGR